MADLTARFGADFTAFKGEVAQAEADLKGLDTSAAAVQGTLTRMSDSFSGSLMVAEAAAMTVSVEDLGVAVSETDEELGRFHITAEEAAAQLNSVGTDVPVRMREIVTETKNAGGEVGWLTKQFAQLGGMIAASFTVQSFVAFGKQVIEFASNISKTATQTGMLTDEVQKLMYVADQTDVSFTAVTSATQGLQDALGSKNSGVIGAIKDLGINYDEFLKLGTYDQLLAISDGLRAIEGSNKFATIAADLFGGKWKEITPLVIANMRDIGGQVSLLSKEELDAIGSWEAAYKRVFTELEVGAGKAAVQITKLFEGLDFWQGMNLGVMNPVLVVFNGVYQQLEKVIGKTDALKNATAGAAPELSQFGTDAESSAAALRRLLDEAIPAAPAIAGVGEAAAAAATPLSMLVGAHDTLAAKMRETYDGKHAKAMAEQAEASRKAAEELKAVAAAFKDVNTPTVDFHTTLAGLDEEVVTHIQNLLGAGKELTTVAKAYGLTATQAAAFKASQDEAATGLAAATREAEGLTNALNKEATEAMKQFAVVAGDSLQDVADKTSAAYAHMSSNSEMYSEQAVEDQYKVARAAQIAADDFQVAQQSAAAAATQAHAAAAEAVTMSWSQAMSAVQAGQGTMGGTLGPVTDFSDANRAAIQKAYDAHRYYGPVTSIPGHGYGNDIPTGVNWEALGFPARAAGGPVSAGSPYMVGEQGPELFVPDRGGTVVPNGAGGGVVANIYVNGTGADVARIINAELTRMMRVGRKWPSV